MENIFDENTTAESIESFFEKSVGSDYINVLPKDYFKALLMYGKHSIKANKNNMTYKDAIRLLNHYLKTFSKLYTSIKISSSFMDSFMFFVRNIEVSDDASVSYSDIPSTKRFIKTHSLGRKSLDDAIALFSTLMLLNSIKQKEHSSFDMVINEINGRIQFNSALTFPRSILNYTVFQYCIPGYPYETKSKRLYSIAAINEDSTDAELIDTYYKNSNAILDFMCDLELDSPLFSNETDIEIKSIKNAYGMIMGLIALSAEESLNETLLRKKFGSKEDKAKSKTSFIHIV